MNMIVQISKLHQQHAEYVSRRERLWSGRPAKVERAEPIALPEPVVVEEKQARPNKRGKVPHSKVVDVIAEKDEQIRRLQLDLSDAQARILTQAEMICALDCIELGSMQKRSVAVIVSEVLSEFPGISWADVKGVRRRRELIRPRHLCMYAVYTERSDLSLPLIGKIFGGKDHSTIHHAVHKVRSELEGK